MCDHADPTLTHAECATCNEALRRTVNDVLPDIELGPNGVDVLMESIRRIAREYAARGPAS